MLIGMVFMIETGGFWFKVSFDCREDVDPETNLKLTIVFNIQVMDEEGALVNDWVDLGYVEELCLEKAIQALSNGEPPFLEAIF